MYHKKSLHTHITGNKKPKKSKSKGFSPILEFVWGRLFSVNWSETHAVSIECWTRFFGTARWFANDFSKSEEKRNHCDLYPIIAKHWPSEQWVFNHYFISTLVWFFFFFDSFKVKILDRFQNNATSPCIVENLSYKLIKHKFGPQNFNTGVGVGHCQNLIFYATISCMNDWYVAHEHKRSYCEIRLPLTRHKVIPNLINCLKI